MAAVTLGVATASTTNASTYASDAFTPAAGDLLIVLVQASATIDAGSSLSDSQGLGFTEVARIEDRGGGTQAQMVAYVANALAAAASMTVTFDCTGDAATGCCIVVLRVSGMSKVGSAAIAQTIPEATGAASTTPEAAFGAAAQTGNPTIGFVGNNNNTANVAEPSGWTEQADIGHPTPTGGVEVVSRDSGFTGTTITWGGTSATAWGAMLLELDTSVPGGGGTFTKIAGERFGLAGGRGLAA